MKHRVRRLPRSLAALCVAAATLGPAGAAVAAPPGESVIVLPGASSTEGIAAGSGTTFYAGDLFTGDIFRGDIRTGAVERFIDAAPGGMAVGMKVDQAHGLLFVAGGLGGDAHVYSTASGAEVATVALATSLPSFVNDVTVTTSGAWFTDSVQAVLYFVPVTAQGGLGDVTRLPLSGPAADLSGQFNNNGIAATADGRALVVAHTGQGALNVVDPGTGASRTIAGLSLPNVDGILLEGRTVYAVLNFGNEIVQAQLDGGLGSGTATKTLTSPSLEVPATVVRFGDRLATANTKFDTGFPPTATSFEVVVLDR